MSCACPTELAPSQVDDEPMEGLEDAEGARELLGEFSGFDCTVLTREISQSVIDDLVAHLRPALVPLTPTPPPSKVPKEVDVSPVSPASEGTPTTFIGAGQYEAYSTNEVEPPPNFKGPHFYVLYESLSRGHVAAFEAATRVKLGEFDSTVLVVSCGRDQRFELAPRNL